MNSPRFSRGDHLQQQCRNNRRSLATFPWFAQFGTKNQGTTNMTPAAQTTATFSKETVEQEISEGNDPGLLG
jgi:hypothetical protein